MNLPLTVESKAMGGPGGERRLARPPDPLTVESKAVGGPGGERRPAHPPAQ